MELISVGKGTAIFTSPQSHSYVILYTTNMVYHRKTSKNQLLETSFITNPASIKPKMAVMWAIVPLPLSSGSIGFWFSKSSSE